MQLILGNKNYSSWSLRAWVLLRYFDVAFEEVLESLAAPELSARLRRYSPTARVPVLLEDDGFAVWDSLAIGEYISERSLDGQGWPADPQARARARSISAEMHAGFPALRSELPMNCRALRTVQLTEAARADIARIDAMWSECRKTSAAKTDGDDGWLFGDFSIADAMYAPVVFRFWTYGIELREHSREYRDRVLRNRVVQEWWQAARAEAEVVPEDETGVERPD